MTNPTSSPAPTDATETQKSGSSAVSAIGYVLAVSYPVLALSTGVRALYQLFFKEGVTDYVAPMLTLFAALLYLVASFGFAYRRRWTWWLSLSALTIETIGVLVVGSLSFTNPEVIGHTVWSHYGQDYGWFPLIQPVLGLVWLLWPATMRMYGIRDSAQTP